MHNPNTLEAHQGHDDKIDLQQDPADCIAGASFDVEASTGHFRSASALLQVPIAKDLTIISRGHASGGSLRLISSPDQPSHYVTVQVASKYTHDDMRNLANICQSSRGIDAREIRLSVSGLEVLNISWQH